MTPVFKIRNLAYSVRGKTLLHGVNLDLESGSITGLIGHNGSGKSTLLRLLARQIPPDAGELHFHNKPLHSWHRRELAQNLGYLPQHLPSADGATIRELVALGRYPWHGALGRPGDTDRAAIEDAMASCGLDGIAEQVVSTLSGGERQRAWIAMLLAQGAQCLLMDEPISALDIAHQGDVLRLLSNLCRKRSMSVVVILHDVNAAARFCDDIVALKAGKVVFQGKPANLMNRDLLAAIYGAEVEVLARSDGTKAALIG